MLGQPLANAPSPPQEQETTATSAVPPVNEVDQSQDVDERLDVESLSGSGARPTRHLLRTAPWADCACDKHIARGGRQATQP